MWHPSVKMSIIFKSLQMITCLAVLLDDQSELVVSFVYALNEESVRRHLWAELLSVATDPRVSGKPWSVLGDFNQTLDHSDSSISPNPNTDLPTRLFWDCLLHAELADLTYRGCSFTWWNKRSTNPIAKKLDRILVNEDWYLKFPSSFGMFDQPRTTTLTWRKKRVKEAHAKVLLLQQQILTEPNPSLAALERSANENWQTLLHAEESFFSQRSRVTWLKEGDLNTAYFHRMTSAR
ncbi:PREDICTED: uncharacterized protein LOC104783602 [Camelina sativa]|uniref:Uncharacterized protein LOC104783602 n=1 Tax=Camelina sativa TaxID=90675 RepID=A0ABM0YWT1_CAMSA|nr:PREDICTED: uncharacterized protein LOC104783602 [Camelina sativa]